MLLHHLVKTYSKFNHVHTSQMHNTLTTTGETLAAHY